VEKHTSYGTPFDPAARRLQLRRIGFLTLCTLTGAGMLALMARALFVERPDALGVAMLLAFAVTLPWTVIGFWNAAIGFVLMVCSRAPGAFVAPQLQEADGDDPITASTALLVCVRNEDPERLRRNLSWMMGGLAARAEAGRFHVYVLSDSDRLVTVAAEEAVAQELAQRFGDRLALTYRRREHRTGYKAGNIRDFCARWGADHAFAIVLDADSLMTVDAMLRLVRIMQRRPAVGILQTLVTGLPSTSAFARIFQFGMRLGMRSYTLGAASWQGDCGPYWGHNAILRLAPFIAHCQLPLLPGKAPLGGHVLSHDQIEAVLMRRAGYEVRVLIDEGGSWEENPPTLTEFIRRDLRWCQGNLQYFHFLALPGLKFVSRCQIALAIAMYLSPAAWIAFLVMATVRTAPAREEAGLALFAIAMVMTFAPKLATLADVLVRPKLRAAFGGGAHVLAGALIETVFWIMIAPTCAVAITLFLLSVALGRDIGWTGQQRDAAGLPLRYAAARLWPQTLLGVAGLACLTIQTPGLFWWLALPIYIGLAASIPMAVLTAYPPLGRALMAAGICRVPEESHPDVHRHLPRPFAPLAPIQEPAR
jgi:membrane glycosyltransferase